MPKPNQKSKCLECDKLGKHNPCDCVCHFNPKSSFDVPEGKLMGCGTCRFTGKPTYPFRYLGFVGYLDFNLKSEACREKPKPSNLKNPIGTEEGK